MAKFDPPEDPFDPKPKRGDKITAPSLPADKPDVVKDQVPKPSEQQKQDMQVELKPSSAKKERAVATEQAAKVQKAASKATMSQAELQASDRGPVQATDAQNQPLTNADGPTIDQEESAPPEPPTLPPLPEQQIQDQPAPAPKQPRQPKNQTAPKAAPATAQTQDDQRESIDPPKREKAQDGQPAPTERQSSEDMKELAQNIKIIADLMPQFLRLLQIIAGNSVAGNSQPVNLGSEE